jgi:hypothetical protein
MRISLTFIGFVLIMAAVLIGTCCATKSRTVGEACPDGLIAYWKFDEGKGDTAYDSVGDNDGVIHNGAGWVPGKVGRALSFDGDDDRLRLPSRVISGDTLTINLWLKTNDGYFSLISGANGTFDNEYGLVHFGTLLLGYHDSHSSNSYYTNISINDNSWHMISIVSEISGTRFYVDGKLREEPDPPFGTKDEFRIEALWLGGDQDCVGGCWDRTQQFMGIVDEIAIYHRALSKKEIEQHYNRISEGKSYCDR